MVLKIIISIGMTSQVATASCVALAVAVAVAALIFLKIQLRMSTCHMENSGRRPYKEIVIKIN